MIKAFLKKKNNAKQYKARTNAAGGIKDIPGLKLLEWRVYPWALMDIEEEVPFPGAEVGAGMQKMNKSVARKKDVIAKNIRYFFTARLAAARLPLLGISCSFIVLIIPAFFYLSISTADTVYLCLLPSATVMRRMHPLCRTDTGGKVLPGQFLISPRNYMKVHEKKVNFYKNVLLFYSLCYHIKMVSNFFLNL